MNRTRFEERSVFEAAPDKALPLTAKEDKQWASTAHFGGVFGFLPSLIIYMIYRDRGPFTAQESKEAFNFSFPLSVALGISFIAMFVLPAELKSWPAIVALLIWIPMSIFSIIGGVRANKGEPYQYPFNLHLFSLDSLGKKKEITKPPEDPEEGLGPVPPPSVRDTPYS